MGTAIVISQTTILNYVLRLHAALAEWEAVRIEPLLKQQALNTDETSMRVNGGNQWVHVLSAGVVTLKFLLAKSDAHNLLERLQKHEQAVLLFARNPFVPFTNNRAERDLRMGKVKQKVSGCFRNQEYAKAYCRISSYLQTMAHKGFNPLIAVQIALQGKAALMMDV